MALRHRMVWVTPPSPVWPLPESLDSQQGDGVWPQAPDSQRQGPWRLEGLLSLCFSPGKEVLGRMESEIERKE